MLSIVIPARDEEGCIASTVEHLHLELKLHAILHKILIYFRFGFWDLKSNS